MPDFETHPAGTADLVKRLRSNTPNMAVGHAAMRHAADRIEQLEAALTRANTTTAAAYEVAARLVEALEMMRSTYPYNPPCYGWQEQVEAHKTAKAALAAAKAVQHD